MKKKVLYGVVMAFLAGAGMSSLQSCKDDLADVQHQLKYDIDQLRQNLQSQIDALNAALKGCQASCGQNIEDLKAQIKSLQDQIDALKKSGATDAEVKALENKLDEAVKNLNAEIANKVTYEELTQKLKDLQTALDAANKAYADQAATTAAEKAKAEALAQLALEIGKVNEAIGNINTNITNLDNKYAAALAELEQKLKDATAALNGSISDLDSKINALDVKIDNLGSGIESLKGNVAVLAYQMGTVQESVKLHDAQIKAILAELNRLDGQDAAIAEVKSQLATLAGKYAALQEQMDAIVPLIEEYFMELQGEIGSVWNQVARISNELDELSSQFNALVGRVDSLITGILLQSTYSPVFGDFSLPIGVKSNVLFNWYGRNNGEAFQFPSVGTEYAYDGQAVLTPEDIAGVQGVTINNGYLGDEVALGKLYLTVNPIGHNFDNTKFSLETSAGRALSYGLRVSPSDKELNFGWTRSVANGFYEADVVMPTTSTAIDETRIEIEESLKAAAKDMLKDPSRRGAFQLLKGVYDQVNGKFPAYAVRYDWSVDGQPYSVLSQYDLAVATAKPLSYAFLYGEGTSKKIPTIGNLQNILTDLIDKDKFKFELNTDFKIDKFQINFSDLVFNFGDLSMDMDMDNVEITVPVTIPSVDIFDEAGNKIGYTAESVVDVTITGTDLSPMVEAIKDGFKNAIEQMADQLNGQINDQIREKLIAGIQDQVNKMLDDIQDQINAMLKDLSDQINGQISDMIDDIVGSLQDKTGALFDRVNKIIDIYNKVANKINDFLADPNHYLQVAMFYRTSKSGVAVLSNVKADPTIFTGGNGDAIGLYASSYSAEILVPAYKKYIAVTNVYNPDGTVNAAAKADLPAINKASGLGQVLPGGAVRVGVKAAGLKKGLTYEIVYQGVDYSGKTSTQKFYIKVK